jgi:hypothetical protein
VDVLYQHRMQFINPGQWELVLLPVRDFVRTRNGETLLKQNGLNACRYSTLGLSISRQDTDFQLDIKSIKMCNVNTGDAPSCI